MQDKADLRLFDSRLDMKIRGSGTPWTYVNTLKYDRLVLRLLPIQVFQYSEDLQSTDVQG